VVFGSSAAFVCEGQERTGHFMGVLGMAASSSLDWNLFWVGILRGL